MSTAPVLPKPLADAPPRSFWQRRADALFGYDFFISYAHSDGETYAHELAKALSPRFECFLDTQDYSSGDDWKVVGAWALKRTSRLVVVGTPAALQSEPVLREVRVFCGAGKRVIPIDFGGSLDPEAHPGNPLFELISDATLRIQEPAGQSAIGPTPETVRALTDTFNRTRQVVKRRRWLQALVALLTLLLGLAAWQWSRAVSSQKEADRALIESFLDRGEVSLADAPELAVNLAFQLSELTDSPRTTDLVGKALAHLPAWRIVPPSADPRLTLDIAADPLLTVLLTVRRPGEIPDGRFELALWDLERGEVSAQTALAKGERLVTPDSPTTKIFATSTGNGAERTIRIRDLSAKGLGQPGFRIPNVRQFACTNGDWPCYVLHSDGTLRRYAWPGAQVSPPIDLGRFPSAWAVHAHPGGRAVALLGGGVVTWIAIGTDGRAERSHTFPGLFQQLLHDQIQSLDLNDETNDESANVKLGWGPQPWNFLVAAVEDVSTASSPRVTGERHLRVTSIWVPADSAHPSTRVIYEGAEPIRPWLFEVADEGRRFAVAESGNDYGEETFHVVDIDWRDLEEYPSLAIHDRRWTVLGTTEHPLLKNFPAVFAPSGAFLVTASFNFQRGEDHPFWSLRTYGRLLTWNTPDRQNALEEDTVAVELPAGSKPMVRLAYSKDSSRLLAWGADGVTRVFKLLDRGGIATSRESREWSRFTPEVVPFGPGFRYSLVYYADDDIRYYDQANGSEIRLNTCLPGETVLATESVGDLSALTAVTGKAIVRLQKGHVIRKTPFPDKAEAADIQPDVTTVRVGRQLRLFDTASLDPLGTVDLPPPDDDEIRTAYWSMRAPHGSVLVFGRLGRDDAVWEIAPPNPGNGSSAPSVHGPTSLLHLSRRALSPRRIVRSKTNGGALLAAEESDRDTPGPRFIRLADGRNVTWPAPNGGWPPQLGDLEYAATSPDGTIFAIFEGRGSTHYAVRWDEVQGRPPEIKGFQPHGDSIAAAYETHDTDVAHLLWGHGLESDVPYSVVRLSDGRTLWQGTEAETLVPPFLRNAGDRAVLANPERYRKFRQTILLGGIKDRGFVSNAPLPVPLQAELDRLRLRMSRYPW
jgi:hypothetical protein